MVPVPSNFKSVPNCGTPGLIQIGVIHSALEKTQNTSHIPFSIYTHVFMKTLRNEIAGSKAKYTFYFENYISQLCLAVTNTWGQRDLLVRSQSSGIVSFPELEIHGVALPRSHQYSTTNLNFDLRVKSFFFFNS